MIGLVSRWAATEGGVGDDAQAYPEFSRQVFDAAPVGFQIAVAELQAKYGKVGRGGPAGLPALHAQQQQLLWYHCCGPTMIASNTVLDPILQPLAGLALLGTVPVMLSTQPPLPSPSPAAGGAAAVCAAGPVDGTQGGGRGAWEGNRRRGAARARLVSAAPACPLRKPPQLSLHAVTAPLPCPLAAAWWPVPARRQSALI